MNKKTNFLIYCTIAVLIFLTVATLPYVSENTRAFIANIENKTFDLRQKILNKNKKPSENIVIIEIDTKSYEYITDKYGTWPTPRSVWANLAKEVEKYNPEFIVFDLLFPKKYANFGRADEELIKVINENKNILNAMNFDNEERELRTPIILPEALKYQVNNDNNYIKGEEKGNPLHFTNCLTIMPEILNNKKEIAFVNFVRDKDGIIRQMPLFYFYQNDYYINLSLLTALKHLKIEEKTFDIKNNYLILDNNHKIPLTLNDDLNTNKNYKHSGMSVLNWYGEDFGHVSLWKVLKKIEEKDSSYLSKTFKNKIVYIGTTAPILGDIKNSPLSSHVSGVEMHATFLNNVLQNDLIKKTSLRTDILISFLMCILIGIIIIFSKSIAQSLVGFLGVVLLHIISSFVLISHFNLWIGVTIPLASYLILFTAFYITKYFLKSKDYEQTYKLAVEDGLTKIYNHRYFQEQMTMQRSNYLRYQTAFSLIMIDIDFFKKFNDTWGHQSGDAVLKQVAQTLKSCVRSTDIVCRYGGEEMTVILTNTKKDEAITTANKICEMVRKTKVTLAGGNEVNVTISVGVATMPDNADTVKKMIEYCDKCLYKAKENGRNQVVSSI